MPSRISPEEQVTPLQPGASGEIRFVVGVDPIVCIFFGTFHVGEAIACGPARPLMSLCVWICAICDLSLIVR